MEYFLQKAHHQRNPNFPLKHTGDSLLGDNESLNCCTKSRIFANGFFVRRLYGDTDTSQQNSSTAFSASVSRPASSNTSILFAFPSILSYSVPFGILYRTEACVKRNF